MVLRKKPPAPKSDAVNKFLDGLFAKAQDPIPTSEVKKAAEKLGLNWHTLDEMSRGRVVKQKGQGGVHYWYPPMDSAYVSETPAVARKNAAAFRAGYEEAVAEMQWRVQSRCSALSDKKSKDLCWGLLELLKSRSNVDK